MQVTNLGKTFYYIATGRARSTLYKKKHGIKFETHCYDQETGLELDFYRPKTKGPHPVIIHFHGGGWIRGARSYVPPAVLEMLDHSFAIASVSYSFAQQKKWPNQLAEISNAYEFLVKHAEQFTIDRSSVFLWGFSAGGFLAESLALKLGKVKLKGTVAWYPISDLSKPEESILVGTGSRKIYSYFLGYDPLTNATEAAKQSPIANVTSRMAPILIMHGTADSLVDCKQSVDFQHALQSVGVDAQLHLIEGAKHGDPIFNARKNANLARNFLLRQLK